MHSFSARSIQTLVAGAFCVLLSGCGSDGTPDLHQVSGTLTVNGEPVSDFIVVMTVDGHRPSTGSTDENGNFTMYYTKENPGVVAGENLVTLDLVNYDPDINPRVQEYEDVLTRFNEENSDMKVTITQDEPDYQLDIQ